MVGKRPFLIITGMHRSGTSFLARALNMSGVFLGDLESLTSHELMYSPDNERGHWENKKILELTKKTLSANHGEWDKLPKKITINKKLGKEIGSAIKEITESGSLAAGFKDPRIIPCLDSWLKFLPKEIVLVGIFRHPLKVAESLKIRDGFSYEKSLQLWKTYNEILLSRLEKKGGFLLNFDWPKNKLLSEIKLISKKLGLDEKIDLSSWYTKELFKADKTYKSNFPIKDNISDLYSRLKKKSNNNAKVKIKKISRTTKELENIVKNLLLENKKQAQYFKKINEENLDLLKNLKEKKSIAALVAIYSKRIDLREVFPEVVTGDYTRLVEWAIAVCEGKIEDVENKNKALLQFLPDYKEYQKLTKLSETELSKKIEQINALNASVNEQTRILEENKGTINQLESVRGENEKRIGELDTVRGENEKRIGELDAVRGENEKRIGELESVRGENEKRIGELDAVRGENEKRIGELDAVREENEKRIDELKSFSKEQSFKIDVLEKENQKVLDNTAILQGDIDLLRNEIDLLKGSVTYQFAKDVSTFIEEKAPQQSRRGKLIRKIAFKKYGRQTIKQSYSNPSEFSYDYHFDDTLEEDSVENQLKFLDFKPKISIIMPVYNPKPVFLKRAIESVKNQYYTNWQLCVCDDGSTSEEIHKILEDASKNYKIKVTFSKENNGISHASNKALELVEGDFVTLIDNDDEFAKNALLEIVKKLNEKPDTDFIYSDENKLDDQGKHVEPYFKPDWSPDLFLSYNYTIHVSVYRTSILKKIGGFRIGFEGAQDYDLNLRFLEETQKIAHIPKVLYSWRKSLGSTALLPFEKDYAYGAGKKALQEALKRRNLDAVCEDGIQMSTYRIRYQIKNKPLVSIVIPTKTLDNLKVCINSILKKSTYRNFEIIVMDTSSDDKIEKFCKNLNEVRAEKISQRQFNFSNINNQGVSKTKGEYIVFLNDDTKVKSPNWIEGLLEHAQRKEIGIVGAKLLYDDDTVQHAGTIVGIQGHAGNYGGMHMNEQGYFSHAKIIRNCSAVTAACMMMKKEIFNKFGGFDEKLANSWQDVDLCIRVIKSGKLVLYTPYSVLYHYEGSTRGDKDSSEDELVARKIFREKQLEFITSGDPYYNPNLSLVIPYKTVKTYAPALKVLVDIYEKREDLRKKFPNEQKNDFRNVIDWAATHGIVSDSEQKILQTYNNFYFENCSNAAKPLASNIMHYLKNKEIQQKFPEVKRGNTRKFLQYMQERTIQVDKN